jgi:hypothetical protein
MGQITAGINENMRLEAIGTSALALFLLLSLSLSLSS